MKSKLVIYLIGLGVLLLASWILGKIETGMIIGWTLGYILFR